MKLHPAQPGAYFIAGRQGTLHSSALTEPTPSAHHPGGPRSGARAFSPELGRPCRPTWGEPFDAGGPSRQRAPQRPAVEWGAKPRPPGEARLPAFASRLSGDGRRPAEANGPNRSALRAEEPAKAGSRASRGGPPRGGAADPLETRPTSRVAKATGRRAGGRPARQARVCGPSRRAVGEPLTVLAWKAQPPR